MAKFYDLTTCKKKYFIIRKLKIVNINKVLNNSRNDSKHTLQNKI